ncbi:MAG: GNAT family N-acetyltransferase [Planctomycetales bacterium]|nr:GNAT family N-acetyltransferase [Planctomycetales bacterium]
MIIRITSNESRYDQVLKHVWEADAGFTPRLSERVDLTDYARKLCDLAERDEAWSGSELVGLVATYCNNRSVGAYISNVSVLPTFQRQGLADALIRRALERARKLCLRTVTLQLHTDNHAALALYKRHGFTSGSIQGDQLKMSLYLDGP